MTNEPLAFSGATQEPVKKNNHHVIFSLLSSKKRSKKRSWWMSLTCRACAISSHTAETWSMSWGHYLRWWLWDACPRCFQSGRFQLMVDSLGLRAGDGRSIWWRRGAFICFRWGAVTEGSRERERERGGKRKRKKTEPGLGGVVLTSTDQWPPLSLCFTAQPRDEDIWSLCKLLRSIFAESLAAALLCSRLLTKSLLHGYTLPQT